MTIAVQLSCDPPNSAVSTRCRAPDKISKKFKTQPSHKRTWNPFPFFAFDFECTFSTISLAVSGVETPSVTMQINESLLWFILVKREYFGSPIGKSSHVLNHYYHYKHSELFKFSMSTLKCSVSNSNHERKCYHMNIWIHNI